jgi:hypothetical protein
MFAIGAIFALSSSSNDVYVHAKLKSDPDGATMCVDTDVQCDPSGSAVCTVVVAVTGGSITVVTAGVFRPYKIATNCQTEMNGTMDKPGGICSLTNIDRILP